MDLKHYFTSPLEAVRVTDDNMEEIATWCGGRVVHDDSPYVWVPVPEGSKITAALKGMWITRRCVISLKGEIKYTFSVFRPDYFAKNYFDSPTAAVEKTWEKAATQRSRKKKQPKTSEPTVNVVEESLKARFDAMEATMHDMAKRLGMENPGAHVDPMSDAIIVKPGEPFAHEVLQNAENVQVTINDQPEATPADLVRQHLGLTADALPDGDGLPKHLTESQLEGMDEATVERIVNGEVTFIHHHGWAEVCAEVGCKIEDYEDGPHKQIFTDKTFAVSAFGAAAEIESQYEEVSNG